jgi:hypothetical protein
MSTYPAGAIARQGQYQVIFANNLNTEGAIDQQTPDAKRLRSNILGLAYYDRSSGQIALIAQIQDSEGQLISANQVLYPNAFTGVNADVRYTYKKGSFEQDVILREQPPTPESLGLNSATTEIEVLTEFLNPPAATLKEHVRKNQLPDQDISWGVARLGQGKAFDLGEPPNRPSRVPVRRQYETVNRRTILIEAIPLLQIQPQLQNLPLQSSASPRSVPVPGHSNLRPDETPGTPQPLSASGPFMSPPVGPSAAAGSPGASSLLSQSNVHQATPVGPVPSPGASDQPTQPNTPKVGQASSLTASPPHNSSFVIHNFPLPHPHPMTLAQSASPRRSATQAGPLTAGFVLDYVELNTDQNGYTFQSDTTYLVDGQLTLTGAVTFEGGTVIKNDQNGQIYIYGNDTANGGIVCPTGPCRAAIFTSLNDGSVGESLDWYADPLYTGSPSVWDVNLFLFLNPATVVLHNLRFSYAGNDIVQGGWTGLDSLDIWDCQFVNVDTAVYYADYLGLHNVLISTAAGAPDPQVGAEGNILAENVTSDNASSFSYDSSGVALVNCLITQPDGNGGTYVSTDNVNWTDTTAPVYQSAGGGNYYLAPGSPFQGAGTTDYVTPALLADLAAKTTWPPTVYALQELAGTSTLSPTVPRDNSGTPDLGYHYDPIDYLVGGCDLSLGSLVLTAGTTLAWYDDFGAVAAGGQPYGLSLDDWSWFSATGTPAAPCWLTRYNTVQEGVTGATGGLGGLMFNDRGCVVPPQINATFTKCSTVNGVGNLLCDNGVAGDGDSAVGSATFANCEFYGDLSSDWPSYYFTNCLFFRANLTVNSTLGPSSVTLQTCTFWQGAFTLGGSSGPAPATWTIFNTAFDGTAIATFGPTPYCQIGYNAYINNDSWLGLGADNLFLQSDTPFPWQTNWLGNFYQPPTSPLLQKGNTYANLLGLYEFTTQTNQAKEGDAVVDIGYHYVATDPYGNPLDTYWQGIPDYLADPTGNGTLMTWAQWEIYYFGQTGLDPNTLDAQGNTLTNDYQNPSTSLYPNRIAFTLAVTNNYVNISSANVQLAVTTGIPGYYAVSVNNAAFNWLPFLSTNLTVMLGPTDAVYTVSVGLEGPAPGAAVTWQTLSLTLDTVAPTVFITSPTVNVTAQPTVQLQGYATKGLSAVSYEVSNALGVVSNQTGFVTLAYFDSSVWAFTTNWIQCYDIDLTNGLNTITLQVTDEAGNTTTTNLNLTLDYTTATNPVVQVVWPPDGAQIGAPSFTCRGSLDDPTASVQAQITDANTNTTTIAGLVGRDGGFWVENLPLTNGANTLSLVVSNAAGLITTTNLTVSPSATTLTLDPVPSAQLWQPLLNVTGAVSDASCAIWVNGVQGVNNGDGTWYALNVSNAPGGVATFDLTAQSSLSEMDELTGFYFSQDSSGQNLTVDNANTDKPAQIVVTSYDLDWTNSLIPDTTSNSNAQPHFVGPLPAWTNYFNLHWREDGGTTGSEWIFGQNTNDCPAIFNWPPDEDIVNGAGPSQSGVETYTCSTNQVVLAPPPLALEYCDISTTTANVGGITQYTRRAKTILTLLTGGKGLSQQKCLFKITANAFAVTNLTPFVSIPVPPTQIYLGELGRLGPYSNLWCILPDNASYNITPKVEPTPSLDYYTFQAGALKYTPITYTQYPALTDPDRARTTIGVGEQVNVGFDNTPGIWLDWKTSAGSVSNTFGVGTVFTAPSNATPNVIITASFQGTELTYPPFDVIEPDGVKAAIISTTRTDLGNRVVGAWMQLNVVMQPTTVSFYRVEMLEIGEDPTNVTGYFTNHWPLSHDLGTKANTWHPVDQNNLIDASGGMDTCAYYGNPLMPWPWSPGGQFTWPIPAIWSIGGVTNNPLQWSDQIFTLDSRGTMTITKFQQTVTRTFHNVITPKLP